MPLDRDQLIKLLNLTRSEYDAEALNAIRHADALLRKHQATWADLLALPQESSKARQPEPTQARQQRPRGSDAFKAKHGYRATNSTTQVQFGRSPIWRDRHPGSSANKRAADSRAHALASTIRKLMAASPLSRRALADELNRRRIPTARGGSWHYTTIVRILTRLGLITAGKGRTNFGLAHKQAADARAKALAPTIRKLRKAGFVEIKAIARQLNERRIPTAKGCKWHPNSTWRLLHRLERLEHSSALRRPMSDAEPRARPRGRHRR